MDDNFFFFLFCGVTLSNRKKLTSSPCHASFSHMKCNGNNLKVAHAHAREVKSFVEYQVWLEDVLEYIISFVTRDVL